jgi:hypothetical protein
MKIVAFYANHAQSGKSECANHLMVKHGYKLFKFADPVKSMTASLLQYVEDDPEVIYRMLEDDLKEVTIPVLGVSPRQIMEGIGHSLGREILNEDIWVNIMALRLAKTKQNKIVIDDLRYENEFYLIKGLGGGSDKGLFRNIVKAFYGSRFINLIKRLFTKDHDTAVVLVRRDVIDNNPSSNRLRGLDFDAEIVNDGSLFDLHEKVNRL